MFTKIAVAITGSPTLEALLAASRRLQLLFDAEILLLHVEKDSDPKEEEMLRKAVESCNFYPDRTSLFFETGHPADTILSFCKQQQVDLLVAGALKKENLFRSYLASIGRKIIRSADCSILILVDPSRQPTPFREIVVNGSEQSNTHKALEVACMIGQKEKARHVHILKDIKLFGLTMAMAGEDAEAEYSEKKKKLIYDEIKYIKQQLENVDTTGLNLNIKIISGKPGLEISKFTKRVEADLLVWGGAEHRLNFFDRIMSHDLEYVLNDIPANMLIVH